MSIRTISESIMAELQQGYSREDVYKRLAASAPSDAGKIAYCIASVPKDQLRNKYIKHNAVLFVFLVIYSILNLVSGLPVKTDEPTLFLVLTTLIPLVFSYFVFRFHGGVYRIAGIWFLIDLGETILLTGVPDNINAFKLIVLFMIIVLALTIGRKVFPNLGILGPRKDSAGNFRL